MKRLQLPWMLMTWPIVIVYFTLIAIPFWLATLVSRGVADAMLAPAILVLDVWAAVDRWLGRH